jgi:hypothetical protein
MKKSILGKRKRKETHKKDKKRKKKQLTKEQKERQEFLKKRSEEHKKSIKRKTKKNKKKNKKGKIRCNKLPYRFSKGNKLWPNRRGYKNINVCSGSTQIYKELSPMKLGPIKDIKVVGFNKKIYKIEAKNLENLWQASKVWKSDLNSKNQPKKEWYIMRDRYYKDSKAYRHIKKSKTKKNVNIPLYSLWVNQNSEKVEKLSYLEARWKIYCPIYEDLVKNTKAFNDLKKLIDNGTNLQILGYDGYDYESQGKTLDECFDNDTVPFGHELALVSILKNDIPWKYCWYCQHLNRDRCEYCNKRGCTCNCESISSTCGGFMARTDDTRDYDCCYKEFCNDCHVKYSSNCACCDVYLCKECSEKFITTCETCGNDYCIKECKDEHKCCLLTKQRIGKMANELHYKH